MAIGPTHFQRPFTIGAVLSATITTFFNRFFHFVPLALLCYLPTMLYYYITQGGSEETDLDSSVALVTVDSVLAFLVPMICTSIFASIATYEVVMEASGRRPSLGEALAAALPRIIPVILASLLYTLLVGLGFVALIIPGLILMSMFWTVVPIVVMEGLGPASALTRSADLTKGFRWRVLGLFLVIILIWSVFQFGVNAAITVAMTETGSFTLLIVISIFNQVLYGVVNALAVAFSYVHLKVAKEGADVHELARVFE